MFDITFILWFRKRALLKIAITIPGAGIGWHSNYSHLVQPSTSKVHE